MLLSATAAIENLPSGDSQITVPVGVSSSTGGSSNGSSNGSPVDLISPAEMRAAYGVTELSFDGQPLDGAGITIAIVDAYNDSDIISDANAFSEAYGLPEFNGAGEPTLTVLNENGGSSLQGIPSAQGVINGSMWALEESIDVEWAHAMAPEANIVLYEASSSGSDLYTAANTAGTSGASVVSMSWGADEFEDETELDSIFNETGVTFLASTGDHGVAEYPAFSPNVVAVGGTSLSVDTSGHYLGESYWNNSYGEGGFGTSTMETQPSYQNGKVNGISTTNRTAPDVSMNAGTLVDFIDSLDGYNSTQEDVGAYGTSVAAPMFAGLIALVDQGRGTGNALDSNQTLTALYNLPSSDFNEVTQSNNTTTAGYQQETGLGSPIANLLVPDLVATPVIADPDFASPAVGTGSSAYVYDPSGAPWTYSNSSGVTGNGSAFTSGNPAAPAGTQVAFLQDTGTISQAVYFATGTYTLSVSAAQRGNLPSTQAFEVLVDGNVVGTFTPPGTSYTVFTTSPFTLTAGTHTILFEGLDPNGGDNTVFLDQVAVTLIDNLAGRAFGQPAVGTGPSAYVYDPSGAPWTYSNSSGVAGNGSAFTSGNPAAPAGTQVAFVQKTGTVSQAVDFAAGIYTLSVSSAQRANLSSTQTFEVLIDGNVVGSFTPSGTSYTVFTTSNFTVTAGAHTILFEGLNPNGADNTVFLDQVVLSRITVTGAAQPAPIEGDAVSQPTSQTVNQPALTGSTPVGSSSTPAASPQSTPSTTAITESPAVSGPTNASVKSAIAPTIAKATPLQSTPPTVTPTTVNSSGSDQVAVPAPAGVPGQELSDAFDNDTFFGNHKRRVKDDNDADVELWFIDPADHWAGFAAAMHILTT